MPWRKATNMFYALQHSVGASIVGCHLETKRLSRTEYGTDCVSVWSFSTLVRCTPYQLKMDWVFFTFSILPNRFVAHQRNSTTSTLYVLTCRCVDFRKNYGLLFKCTECIFFNKFHKIKVKIFFDLNVVILLYR